MPALHIRDIPEETLAALKRRAAFHDRSVQQELRVELDRIAQEPLTGRRPRPPALRMVTTGHSEAFDRNSFYGEDER